MVGCGGAGAPRKWGDLGGADVPPQNTVSVCSFGSYQVVGPVFGYLAIRTLGNPFEEVSREFVLNSRHPDSWPAKNGVPDRK